MGTTLRRVAWVGGLVAGVLLIVAGALWIYIGFDARNEVHDTITREQIVGSPDMSPDAITKEVADSGLSSKITDLPSCDVADKPVNDGTRAKCFADYMRIHALESSEGRTYAQMGRYLTAEGEETNDQNEAAKDPKTGQPVTNGARDLWVTQRALATGLELSYVGEQVSLFSIATGALFVVIGIGLLVMLTLGGVLTPERFRGRTAP